MGPVTDTHRVTYRENVMLAVQERKKQFDDAFMFDPDLKGKQVQVTSIVGTTEARQDAPEGGDTPDIDVNHEPVWVRPTRLDWGKVIRKEDQIKALTTYQSEYVQSGATAIVRKRNALLASAIFGPRLIGNEVPVSTAWAGKTVAVDLGSPATPNKMKVAKILNAIRQMEDDEVVFEEEDPYLVLDPEEIESLWGDLTFVSKDYRDQAQLDNVNKRVMAIFGIPIIPSKRIANFDGSTSTAGLFLKSGMVWGEFMALNVQSSPNPAKQYREHPYMETWLGATRTEDAKAVKILNKIG